MTCKDVILFEGISKYSVVGELTSSFPPFVTRKTQNNERFPLIIVCKCGKCNICFWGLVWYRTKRRMCLVWLCCGRPKRRRRWFENKRQNKNQKNEETSQKAIDKRNGLWYNSNRCELFTARLIRVKDDARFFWKKSKKLFKNLLTKDLSCAIISKSQVTGA